jgi:hypothetical protein
MARFYRDAPKGIPVNPMMVKAINHDNPEAV